MLDAQPSISANAETQMPAAADWLWRPWYAKIWCAAIPIYWMGATASLKLPALAAFYDSVPAAYLNILFFPPTALLILGFGFARAWLDRKLVSGDLLSDEEIDELKRMEDEKWERSSCPHWSVDRYDPRSGILYVGNPFGPNSGNPF